MTAKQPDTAPQAPKPDDHLVTRAVAPWQAWLVRIFGTSFGLGYIPFASGTFGTLPAVGMFVVVAALAPAEWLPWLLAAMTLVASAACVAIGNWAEGVWGRKDPGRFTLDEIAGYLLTVLLFHPPLTRQMVAWTFLVTRMLDIVKPFPARHSERLPGGWGILLDDLISSVYAAIILYALNYYRPELMM
jgi:phosphatidylglycerophosphatase A